MDSLREIYFTSISESVQDALSVAEYRGGLLDLKGFSSFSSFFSSSSARRIATYFTNRPTERAELLNF